MKLTLNHVLDWMQQVDPNGTFAELKNRMLDQEMLDALFRTVEGWNFDHPLGSEMRLDCGRMMQVLSLEWAAAAKPTRTGKIAAMLGMCPQGYVWSMPVFFTDGTVTARVKSYEYSASSDSLTLHCDRGRWPVELNDDTDFVVEYYYDSDYPDGYLSIAPEWYAKLGG